MSNEFEPRIVAFLCNWCTYAAADTAGVSRMEMPLNVDIIRVMCTGRIEPMFILKAFREGADGVIVSGCHPPGDCHYTNGNYKTFRRMPLVEKLLDQFGIERKYNMADKINLGLYWAASCGGCEIAILELREKILDLDAAANIVFWPVAVDVKYKDVEAMPDGFMDACFFNGAIRTSENEYMAHLLRRKAKVLVAFGSCAHEGCIPGLANLYDAESVLERVYDTAPSLDDARGTRPTPSSQVPEDKIEIPVFYDRVKTLAQTVDVDYFMPGCPPVVDQVWNVFQTLLAGELPAVCVTAAELEDLGITVGLAAEEGGNLYRGLVTGLLERFLETDHARDAWLFACGPWAMLKKVAHLAQATSLRCQVALEEMMACGMGVCNSCVVEVVEPGERVVVEAQARARRRGVLNFERIRLYTRFPFGFFTKICYC